MSYTDVMFYASVLLCYILCCKSYPQKVSDADATEVKLSEIMRYNAPEWPLIVFGCFGSIIAGAIHPAFSFLLSEFIKVISYISAVSSSEDEICHNKFITLF